MIQKAMAIMETSLAQLKNDKDILIAENRNLKTFLQAKNIQPKKGAY